MTIKWTYELCESFAIQCKTRNEFKQRFRKAWRAMHNHNWVESLTKHMDIVGSHKKRCVYIYKFDNNQVYIGLTYNVSKRHRCHKEKGILKKFPNYDKLPEIISDGYINVERAMELEMSTIKKYKENGYIVLNTMKGGQIGTTKILNYSIDELLESAKKYTTRWEFQLKDSKIYDYAKRYKLLDDICGHMIVLHKKFDLHLIIEEIKSCTSYREFTIKFDLSYQKLYNHKMLYVIEQYHEKKCKSLTNEELIKIGKQYKTRGQWIDSKDRKHYETARTRKLLDLIIPPTSCPPTTRDMDN